MTASLRTAQIKTYVAVGCVALSILASSAAVFAATFPSQLEDTLDTIESTVERETNNIESRIESLLKATVEELLGLDCPGVLHIVADGCPSSSGSISVTDSTSIDPLSGSSSPASETETTRIASTPDDDMLSANEMVRDRDLANLDDQEYARENAAPYLGDAGRQQVEKTTEETADLIKGNISGAQSIKKLASEAKELTVTQDVVKNQSEMFSHLGDIAANQTRLDGQVSLGILSLQQQQAALMQLSANLSEAADESNRRERLNQDVSAIEAMRGSIYLPFQQSPN